MADPWHVKWLSEGVQRWNRRRKKVDFSPDLSGVRFFDLLPPDFRDDPKTSRFFERIDLTGANLAQADLSRLNFAKAKFDRADLSAADMSMSNFENASFSRTVLTGASLSRSLLSGAFFEKALLTRVSFDQANMSDATFVASPLDGSQRLTASIQSAHVYPDIDSYRSEAVEEGGNLPVLASGMTSALVPKAKPENSFHKYDVFFGTNRNPIITRGALAGFGSTLQEELSYGVCEVVVPKGHKIGSLGSPRWRRIWNRNDDRLKISSVISLNEALFWSFICETSDKMKVKERPTIFVHGFNNNFEDSVLRAAQIGTILV